MAEEPLFVRVALNAWFVPLHIAAFIFQDRILRPRAAARQHRGQMATLPK